jgi:hypothetical protein
MSTLEVNNIKDTGSNSLISSDGSGTFTINNGVLKMTPAFFAYRTSSNSNLTDDVASKISIDTELFDSDGKYDAGNYRFTPTVAGKYFVYGQVNLSCNTGEQYHFGAM